MSTLDPIKLIIHQPEHDGIFVAQGTATTVSVPLSGEILEAAAPDPAALFRKWYSSLAGDTIATADAGAATLSVGTHVVTYTVKDKNEDGVPAPQLETLFASVEHMGAAGGPPDPAPVDERPCVIHVLAANIVAPLEGAALSKGGATLEAEAPLQWGQYVEATPPATAYPEPNPAYHAVNQVRYRWLFQRTASPNPPVELDVQGGLAMTLIPPNGGALARLRYVGPLPAALAAGQHTLILRVEHAGDPTKAHEATRTVTIVV